MWQHRCSRSTRAGNTPTPIESGMDLTYLVVAASNRTHCRLNRTHGRLLPRPARPQRRGDHYRPQMELPLRRKHSTLPFPPVSWHAIIANKIECPQPEEGHLRMPRRGAAAGITNTAPLCPNFRCKYRPRTATASRLTDALFPGLPDAHVSEARLARPGVVFMHLAVCSFRNDVSHGLLGLVQRHIFRVGRASHRSWVQQSRRAKGQGAVSIG